MDQLDWRLNSAVETLKTVKSDAVATVVAAAQESRNSAVWPKAKGVDDATLLSAVEALNSAAMNNGQREAAKIVISAATESRPMNDMQRTLA